MKRPGPGCAVALAASTMLSGCGREDAPAFAAWDSGGVAIMESLRPAWGEGEVWTVGAEALVRIGVVEGDRVRQFSGITGGARLADGTVVVADGGSQEVRFFGPDGAFRKAVGRPGGGPGEFVVLSGLGPSPEGGVWAYDFSLRRVTRIDAPGEVVRLTTLEPDPPVLNSVGALPDGTFLLRQLWGAAAVAEATTQGLRRDPVAYVRFDATGALLDTLGLFPGREVFLSEEGGRGVMSTPPFAKGSVGAVWGEGLVVGSMDNFDAAVHSPDGALLRILRIPGRDLTLGAGDVEAFIQERIEATPAEGRPGLRESLESLPVPRTRPAYGSFLADALGNLWVAEWAAYPAVPRQWTVLDSLGRWLGEVEMPARFFPWQIGPDWILGVEWDDLDVERMVVYPLRKP